MVEKLVDAEREPIRQLEGRKKNEEARLKLAADLISKIGSITSGIGDLTKFRQFRELVAGVGRPDLMDVTVDQSKADPGAYNIEVVQMAGRSSMMSNGLPDPNETEIGAGYFSYTMPDGDTREVYIDPDNSTLEGIAKTINGQRALNLNAIVVNDGTGSDEPYRLIVTHSKTGETNDAEFPDFYFLDGDSDFYLEKERPAQNSVLKVNGFSVEFEGNKIDSLFPGVSIDLKDIAPGKEFTLNIKEDIKSVKGKVQAVIDKINQVLGFIQQQNNLDKDSNTTNTLGGDITLQMLEYKIRQMVITPLPTEGGYVRLSDVGISFNRGGTLQLQEEKLDKALNTNFEAVAQFFTGIEDDGKGFSGQLKDVVASLTRSNGAVQSRVDGIKNRIRDIDRQIEMKQRQVEQAANNIKEKFAKLESTMANLRSQQAQAAALGGGGGLLPGLG